MLNIVVPMAGRGLRFLGRENSVPKPMIEVVSGKRMIEYVIEYLTLPEQHRFIFVCLSAHKRLYDYDAFFGARTCNPKIVWAKEVTAGPAVSVLLAQSLIDNDDELLVAYCDMFLTIDVGDFLRWNRRKGAAGGVITYPSTNPADSYAQVNPAGAVIRTAEKVLISDIATAGLYYFRHGRDFVRSASKMLACRDERDQELFVNPCYNDLIQDGKPVFAYAVGRHQKIEMGTPDDLRVARSALNRKPMRSEGTQRLQCASE